ncbi:hypothetical protein DJ030_07580 [bacterium endosymbiont of Escarpia laminata]|nr:MAG: hypothetical protein DJ030_07580 [bacterium endosymbiont of Escarpia laminata]
MDDLDLETAPSYFDEETGEALHLSLGSYDLFIEGIDVHMEGVPFLLNDKTGHVSLPIKTKHMIAYFVSEAKNNGHSGISLSPRALGDKRYAYCEKYDFKYSQIDHEFIPGLVRPWDEGFLTPVFFNSSVLNKYSQNPEYRLNLFSETYGNIEAEEWIIAFGINRNRKIIMWLGDIDSLPDTEKYYLRSENIDSDHDIHSEFYDSQIAVHVSDRSRQHHLFHIRSNLNDAFKRSKGVPLFILEGEVGQVIENLNRPVFWDEKNVSPVIESFNRVFVESINVKGLKEALKKCMDTKSVKSLGSLKTFEMWMGKCLGVSDSRTLCSPLYVLYDFRIVSSHLLANEKRENMMASINERLGLEKTNQNIEVVFDRVIEQLITTFERLQGEMQR